MYIYFFLSSSTDVWESVVSELEEQRAKLDLPYIPYSRDVTRQFALSHPLVAQLIEQLPHANRCSSYNFSYHKPSEMTSWRAHVSHVTMHCNHVRILLICVPPPPPQRPVVNLTGCYRSEKFNGIRSPRDMFSFLMSDLRPMRPSVDLMALEYAVVSADTLGGVK